MASKTLVSVEEYLSMPYEGLEPEYWDGEVIERAIPNIPHSKVFRVIFRSLDNLSMRIGWMVGSELRMKVKPAGFLIPDLCVYETEPPTDPPTAPPLIVVEIMSPDDKMAEVVAKLARFLAWGVKHVWLANPKSRTLSVFDDAGLHEVPEFVIEDLRLTPEHVFGA